jgi:four helix bundle protein
MKSHKDLHVWQKAILLAKSVYGLSKELPREETYSLSDQMKRSAVSIASNIAEGAARQTDKEFLQFLYIALGSASELDTQIEICKALSFRNIHQEKLDAVQADIATIAKMIQGLISKVKQKRSLITNH